MSRPEGNNGRQQQTSDMAQGEPVQAPQQHQPNESTQPEAFPQGGAHRPCRTVPRDVKVMEGLWAIGDLIGSGSYGQVFQALRLDTGIMEVVKAVKNTRNAWAQVDMLELLPRHPNLITPFHVSSSRNHIYMFMQYGGSVDLLQYQRQQESNYFDEDIAVKMFSNVAAGVVHLHNSGVCHRDIKPENIMIDKDGTPRLADFGSAEVTSRFCMDAQGTLPFAAPEVLDAYARFGTEMNEGYDGGLADGFSMGVVLFEMIYGLDSMQRVLGWAGYRSSVLLRDAQARANEMRQALSQRSLMLHQPAPGHGIESTPSVREALAAMLCPDAVARNEFQVICDALWQAEIFSNE